MSLATGLGHFFIWYSLFGLSISDSLSTGSLVEHEAGLYVIHI